MAPSRNASSQDCPVWCEDQGHAHQVGEQLCRLDGMIRQHVSAIKAQVELSTLPAIYGEDARVVTADVVQDEITTIDGIHTREARVWVYGLDTPTIELSVEDLERLAEFLLSARDRLVTIASAR